MRLTKEYEDINGLIIIFTLRSFRQCVEPESSDVAFQYLGVFAGGEKVAGFRIKDLRHDR